MALLPISWEIWKCDLIISEEPFFSIGDLTILLSVFGKCLVNEEQVFEEAVAVPVLIICWLQSCNPS